MDAQASTRGQYLREMLAQRAQVMMLRAGDNFESSEEADEMERFLDSLEAFVMLGPTPAPTAPWPQP